MDKQALEASVLRMPPAPAGPWANEANHFEDRVIETYARQHSMLRPPHGVRYLQQVESAALLKREVEAQWRELAYVPGTTAASIVMTLEEWVGLK